MAKWRGIFPDGLEPTLTKIIDRVMIIVRSLVGVHVLPCPPLWPDFHITRSRAMHTVGAAWLFAASWQEGMYDRTAQWKTDVTTSEM